MRIAEHTCVVIATVDLLVYHMEFNIGLICMFSAVPFGLGLPPTAQSTIGAAGMRLPGQPHTGAVLLVSNLNEQVRTTTASKSTSHH